MILRCPRCGDVLRSVDGIKLIEGAEGKIWGILEIAPHDCKPDEQESEGE